MGIFTRVRDIIHANVNSMLDKAEDPEKLIKLIIREMEDTLVEIKANCAAAMAADKRIGREMDAVLEHARMWDGKAQLAVSKGREDLAREALVEKRRWTERGEALERELDQTRELVKKYHEDIRQIEDKLQSAREKQRILVKRHQHAQDKKRAQEQIRYFDSAEALHRFEAFQERIDRMEAEADLVNYARKPTLRDEIAALETDDEIEKELAALKARGKTNV